MPRYFRQSISKGLRFRILERDHFRCRYCGARAPEVELHIDHILPVSLGGGNDQHNLCAACKSCNLAKHARLVKLDEIEKFEALWFLEPIKLKQLRAMVATPEEEEWLLGQMDEINLRERDPSCSEMLEFGLSESAAQIATDDYMSQLLSDAYFDSLRDEGYGGYLQ